MQLLLINKNGEPVQISLPSWKIRLVIVAVVALCSGLIASGFMLRQSSIVDAAVIENWRVKIQEQDAVVEELQTDSVARRQAVGRQIADMQARLWRIEALASYMHESSGLPQDEFDFDAQVSQGGPINPEAEVLNVQNLDSKLANLSERLKQRET